MLSERGRRAVLGIVENIHAAQDFTREMDLASFSVDRRTLYAVVHGLEVISEASRRVDEATRQRHPHLPWRQIAGAGNVYRHAYEAVSPQMVWRTVTERLDELLAACQAELLSSAGLSRPETDHA